MRLISPVAMTILVALPISSWAQECTSVTTSTLAISGAALSGSKFEEPANALPRHCIVTGKVNERTGIDGKSYAIQFEIRLPMEWNGRFLHQANGGNDGTVVPALGIRADGLAAGGKCACPCSRPICPAMRTLFVPVATTA